jgi:hypothetical protein
MSNSSRRNRSTRQRLFLEQEGLCHWCKGPMWYLPYIPLKYWKLWKKQKEFPATLCTLDHIRNSHKHTIKVVAACLACNHERSLLGL